MAGTSIDGLALAGFEHVSQSINKILTTPINSRVMRRDFGSKIPDIIDAPMNQSVLMSLFASTAEALEPRQVDGSWYGEPRFKLEQVEVLSVTASGGLEIQVRGQYFPRGHLGDYTPARDAVVTNVIF